MTNQDALMSCDPAYGKSKPYPSHAAQWREYHGKLAWLFNPWTAERRTPADIGRDPFGELIRAPWKRRDPEALSGNCGNCHMCLTGVIDPGMGIPLVNLRMITCPECGNKRCPKATNHELGCTGSNEPGQPGSVYKRPEMKP